MIYARRRSLGGKKFACKSSSFFCERAKEIFFCNLKQAPIAGSLKKI